MIKSALESNLLSDGIGSKVCELIPSGMIPARLILSPAIFSTMLVIGATVVTTLSFFSAVVAGFSSRRPHAIRNTAAKITTDVITLADLVKDISVFVQTGVANVTKA